MDRTALSPAVLWSMLKESAGAWNDDFAPSMGAAIAYYTAFSIAPLLIIVIAIAGFFAGRQAASAQIHAQLTGLIGERGATAIQAMVESASNTSEGTIASIVGIALLLVGATTVFAELQTDLDRIWKAPAVKQAEGMWGMIRGRLLSFGMVVSIGFIMLVSLVISAALSGLGSWWGRAFADLGWLLQTLNFGVSLAIVTALFALMYKILPRVSIGWHDVWIGALVTAVLFAIGKFLVGLYLGKSSVASSFGAAGSLAVLLVWVYYSAQIFLLGAEFTWVYAHRMGSRRGEQRPATAKATVATTAKPQGEAAASPPGASAAGAWRPTGAVTAPVPMPPLPTPPRTPIGPRLLQPAPRHGGIAALVKRHPAAVAGAALLLGTLAGEALNLREARIATRPRRLRALASDLLQLRKAKVNVGRGRARFTLRPRSRIARLFSRV